MTDALHNEMVTVTTPTGKSIPGPDGTPIRPQTPPCDWGPCNFQPRTSTEDRQAVHIITGEFLISGPLAEWITDESTVIVRGIPYKVKGFPRHFNSGILDHTEITLIKQKG